MINVDDVKKKIINFIQTTGPTLPVKVAKAVEMEPVFASAILGELTVNQQVKMSNMKIGASQLYLLGGQEEQLENFAEEHLKSVEKRAYLSLKENKYLIDKDQEPAIRVALRSIKDFATPFKYKEEIMWRYNFVSKEDILKLLQKTTNTSQEPKEEPKEEPEKPSEPEKSEPKEDSSISKENDTKELRQEEAKPEPKPEPTFKDQSKLQLEPKEESEKKELKKEDKLEEKEANSPWEETKTESKGQQSLKQEGSKVKEKTLFVKSFESPFIKKSENSFSEEVKSFLEKKHIELVEEIEESRNEFIGKIMIGTDLGEMEFHLIARNKKIINENDLTVAYSKASENKMPCYFLHKGKLTKKGEEFLEDYKSLIKVYSM